MKSDDKCNNNELSSIINLLLQFRTDIKMFHWQTNSFAYHKISDELLSSIDDLSDQLVEALSGVLNTRPSMRLRDPTHPCPKVNSSILVRNIELDLFLNELDRVSDVLRNATSISSLKFSEIANIRDEILGAIDKAKYLMTFK
jgi:DNA-binding ferritin-like protein